MLLIRFVLKTHRSPFSVTQNSILTGELYIITSVYIYFLLSLVFCGKQVRFISHTDLLHAYFHELPVDHQASALGSFLRAVFADLRWPIFRIVRLIPKWLLEKLDPRSQMFRDWRIVRRFPAQLFLITAQY